MKGIRRGLRRKNPSAPTRTKSLKTHTGPPTNFSPTEFSGKELPLVYRPKVIKKVDDYLFIFHCTVKGNSGANFNRNMVILVHTTTTTETNNHNEGTFSEEEEEEKSKAVLTLVNPLRLSPEGEERLMELGSDIINIVRLGYNEHSPYEDEYYMNKYPIVRRWAPGLFSPCPDLPFHQRLWDTTYMKVPSLDAPLHPEVPHAAVQVFCFHETAEPEAVLLVEKKRLVIVGDCLQYQVDNPFVNELGQKHLQDHGLLDSKVVISAPWLQMQTIASNNSRKLTEASNSRLQKEAFFSSSANSKFNLRKDFARLLRLKPNRLISTSGNQILQEELKGAITFAVEQTCLLV